MATEERLPLLASEAASVKPKKRSTLLTVCPYILGNELCERLAYYGLATNLVVYITQIMGGDPAFAAVAVAVFEGTCYTTPIIGALLADSVWGRYKTIIVFSLIYLVGIVMLTLSSVVPDSDDDADQANPLQFGLLFASLAVISLGTGGIKPNVSAFGADQFNEADPRDRREKESFFNWFYLAINVGSLFAGTVIVYIQDQISWTIGFAVPGAAMAMAILLFFAGRRGYRHVLPTESPMIRVVKVVTAAVKNRWAKKHATDANNHAAHHHVVAGPGGDSLVSVDSEGMSGGNGSYYNGALYQQALLGNGAMGGNAAAVTLYNGDGVGGSSPKQHTPKQPRLMRSGSTHQMPLVPSLSYRWLEDAVTEWQTSQGHVVQLGGLAGYTPNQVEEVKMVLRLLPIFLTTVLYWTVYTQMCTLFVQQGNLMDRQLAWHGQTLKIPSASMSIFNTLSIIVLVYLYDALLEPLLRRTQRFRMTLLRRQGWGMAVAAGAMLYAGILEARRLHTFDGRPPCAPASPVCAHTNDVLQQRTLLESIPPLTAGGSLRGLLQSVTGTGAGSNSLDGASGWGAADPGWFDGSSSSSGSMSDAPCLCPNEASPLSIFWQAPSYFLIGLSEVLTSIGQLEFFYDQAPDVMRSCSMALCLLSTALGSYLAGGGTLAVQRLSRSITGREWLPRDLNQGHMDYFFYALGVMMAVNLCAFLFVAVRYEYKSVEHKRHTVVVAAQQQQPAAVTIAAAAAGTHEEGGALPGSGGAPALPVQVPPRGGAGAGGHGSRTRSGMRSTQPVAIGRGQGGGNEEEEETESGQQTPVEVYSRSLAYVPPSPNIPAPFR